MADITPEEFNNRIAEMRPAIAKKLAEIELFYRLFRLGPVHLTLIARNPNDDDYISVTTNEPTPEGFDQALQMAKEYHSSIAAEAPNGNGKEAWGKRYGG